MHTHDSNFTPILTYLPYTLGGAMYEVYIYGFATDYSLELLENYENALFKSKKKDLILHAQTIEGAKVTMETKIRDTFRNFIVDMDQDHMAVFMQAMYDFLQKASKGHVSYDLFKSIVEAAPILNAGELREEVNS